MKDKFTPGTRVSELINSAYHEYLIDDLSKGVIVEGTAGPGEVFVQWDGYDGVVTQAVPEKVSELMLEAELEKKISVMEKEFDALSAKIEKKLEKAAALIIEANQLAIAGGQESLSNMDAVSPLYDAFHEIGWSTSSLNC